MMTNEWAEFKAYTEQPIYTAARKTDTTYLGRFTFDMISEFTGFGYILTIIARGYLFHDKDSVVLDDPYERIEITRNALCAWCSIPDKKKSSKPRWTFVSCPPTTRSWSIKTVRGGITAILKM